jgi:pilus assembly protein CpaB
MKAARVLVLAVALAAGGAAAYLIGSDEQKTETAPVVQIATTDVLIAKSDIGMGTAIASQDLQWQAWPAATTGESYITKKDKPSAIEELSGAITRAPFTAGEPIREGKLIRANGAAGYMAAILPSGMRAVSTEISPETGAGGFILPNDRVDVILSKREKNPDRAGPSDVVNSEIILANVRVLAIDQAPKEKDGQNAVVGKTVTLELRPEQAETLSRARQTGTLSLALRSIADLNVVENRSEDQSSKRGDSINVVRYGISTQTTTQK